MKIATWNVNGIRARQAQVLEWIEQERPDWVCLQEIKADREQVPEALCEHAGYFCLWHGYKAYSGVALLARRDAFPEPPRFEHPPFDHESRIVTGTAGGLVVASIYVPNGGKDYPAKLRFLEALVEYAAAMRAAGLKMVLCGDLNVARAEIDVHPKERRPVIGQLPQERALFERLLGAGLVDSTRSFDPDNEGLFTWWAPWRNMRQRNIGWRLDYVLVSEPLMKGMRASRVRSEVGTSDHAPVVAELDLA